MDNPRRPAFEVVMSAALQEKGFNLSGEWRLVDGEPDFHLRDFAMLANVLYAFACDGEVKYIGKTEQKFCCRMCGYHKKLHSRSRAKQREVHHQLRAKIGEGIPVLIYIRPCSRGELTEMEGRCIRALNPDWNRSGR